MSHFGISAFPLARRGLWKRKVDVEKSMEWMAQDWFLKKVGTNLCELNHFRYVKGNNCDLKPICFEVLISWTCNFYFPEPIYLKSIILKVVQINCRFRFVSATWCNWILTTLCKRWSGSNIAAYSLLYLPVRKMNIFYGLVYLFSFFYPTLMSFKVLNAFK